MAGVQTGGIIRRLDEAVINRIAAGEIIQRPSNALKEMIENSLDAKSTNIQITVRDGGLKLMQIQDNGSGIRKDDMEIVCERFTTSKIRTFEDLGSVSTYGFRGEALASISHIAHVTIVSRTADSKCAYKGGYCDGKLKEPVKPCAGNVGTQITVEDLYYNVPMRRKALKSFAEEHQKIVDVVSRYAVHNSGIGFALKKQGDSNSDVKTLPDSTHTDNIRTIYGAPVARELLEVRASDTKLNFEMFGLVSNANYNMKRAIFLLFINNRLVDSSLLRKAVEQIYSFYLPKHTHPFIYISLQIAPQNVDVNVHPTKHEVHFLHEEAIIDQIRRSIDTSLLGCNNSRTFYVKTLLPGAGSGTADDLVPLSNASTKDKSLTSAGNKPYAHQTVRTDCREQKLEMFFVRSSTNMSKLPDECTAPASLVAGVTATDGSTGSKLSATAVVVDSDESFSSENSLKEIVSLDCDGATKRDTGEFVQSDLQNSSSERCAKGSLWQTTAGGAVAGESHQIVTAASSSAATVRSASSSPVGEVERSKPDDGTAPREIKLTSVIQLRQRIVSNMHKDLRTVAQNHKFCGCADVEFALIQHETILYLANVTKISKELFYQLVMFNFGNFGVMRLSEPVPIYELAVLALKMPESGWTEEDGSIEELAQYVVDLLKSKAEMLADYFSMEVDENGNLLSLPLLLDNYVPFMSGLPMYILRLATEVDWETEKECFETFARETSDFYAFKKKWVLVECAMDSTDPYDTPKWQWTVEHVLFPAVRHSFMPPTSFSSDGTFLNIANLTDLYKVFERC